MSVTTFAPAATSRRRLNLPLSGIFSFVKNIFSKPKRILFAILVVLAAFGLYTIFFAGRNSSSTSKPLPLAHNFEVVAKTKEGKNTNGRFPIEVTSAFRAESVLVQGQRVTAKNDKEFLVLTMEISNNYNVPLYIYPVDSFRLIDSQGKKFAPSAHQGNVEARPQSTKTSNVGFVVAKGTKKFKVEVGELSGEKTILEFTLK